MITRIVTKNLLIFMSIVLPNCLQSLFARHSSFYCLMYSVTNTFNITENNLNKEIVSYDTMEVNNIDFINTGLSQRITIGTIEKRVVHTHTDMLSYTSYTSKVSMDDKHIHFSSEKLKCMHFLFNQMYDSKIATLEYILLRLLQKKKRKIEKWK